MPFKSLAQSKYMFIHHPDIAKEFANKTDYSKLPKKKLLPKGKNK